MRALRLFVAALLTLVGGIWIGQGLGLVPGSFMTNDIRWAVAGVVLIAIAGALVWSARPPARR